MAALRSCERVITRGEGRMFYVRVPGARCVSGFLLLIAALIVAALKACLIAAACVRVCAFTAAWVVAVSETGSSCSRAGGPLLE